MALQEYKHGTTFPGVIGRTIDQSSPAWPKQSAPKKALPMYSLLC
jgi:arylsulfatase